MCGRAYTSVRINLPQPMRKYGPLLFCHIITPFFFFFSRRPTLWSTCPNTPWWSIWSATIPHREQNLPASPYAFHLFELPHSCFSSITRYCVHCDGLPLKKKNMISVKRPRRTFESDIVFAPLALSDIKPTAHRLNNCCLNWMAQFNSRHQSKGF